jgi:hypothetical protein
MVRGEGVEPFPLPFIPSHEGRGDFKESFKKMA